METTTSCQYKNPEYNQIRT